MGLRGTPGYFQRVLATLVLSGLLYIICVLEIDDIVVHAQNAPECIKLRAFFECLRRHNITFNSPNKCKLFGLSKVEDKGHTVDESGLPFSREKT